MSLIKQRNKFNVYYKQKLIKKISDIKDLKQGEIELVEKNYITGNLWWLKVLIMDIFFGFIGSTYQDDEVVPIKSFTIEYSDIDPTLFEIDINKNNFSISGVKWYSITKTKESIPELMTKRIKAKKKLIIALCISMLVLVAMVISILSLF